MQSESKKRQPFIESQRFLLLNAVDNPRWYLDPDRFREARNAAFNDNRTPLHDMAVVEFDHHRQLDQHAAWVKEWIPTMRREIFLDPELNRLCVTIDGGIGKTTSLRWAEVAIGDFRNADANGYSAVYVHTRDLPTHADFFLHAYKYFDRENVEVHSPGVLVELFRRRLNQPQLSADKIRHMLQRLVQQRRLVLIVDGLDQTHIESDAEKRNPKITALSKFLSGEARRCRAIVAGRPHAVTQYWEELFATDMWRFAQIDGFDDKQRQAYLGKDCADELKRLEADTLAIPRFLEAVRQHVPFQRLKELETTSDVYVELLEHLFKSDDKPLTKDQTNRLLAAVAFQMFLKGNLEGVPRGEYEFFVTELIDRNGPAISISDPSELNAQLVKLGKTNSVLDYCFLDSDQQLSDIYFRDTTLQEFFTALWLVKYATTTDSEWMSHRPWLRANERLNHESLKRVWRFAAEMPPGYRENRIWVQTIGTLYCDQPEHGLRSNEILYRSWDTMERLAAVKRASFADPDPAAKAAQNAIRTFQSEFTEEICGGHRGEVARQITADLLGEFRPIPPDHPGPPGRSQIATRPDGP